MDHEDFETEYVHKFYNIKAKPFSDSRVKPWPYTFKFYEKYVSSGTIVLDSGCGNGRQFVDSNIIGLDQSANLLKEASSKPNIGLVQGNVIKLPFRDEVFDVVLSVAVIHHLSTAERRLEAMIEMRRVMKCGAVGLVYLWHKAAAFHNKFKKLEGDDYFVSWKGEEDALRFYHLYDEQTLQDLCIEAGFEVIECQREQESVFAVIKKIK